MCGDFRIVMREKPHMRGNNPILSIPSPHPNLPRRFYLKHQLNKHYKFFLDLTKTEDNSQKKEDRRRRHIYFLRRLLLLSINQNKETNANQAVS